MVEATGGSLAALLTQLRSQVDGADRPTQPRRTEPPRDTGSEAPPPPRGAGRGRVVDIIV